MKLHAGFTPPSPIYVGFTPPTKLHAGEPIIVPPQYSPEAQLVIDSFPNPLSDKEKNNIALFIDNLHLRGDWLTRDAFAHFGLADPINALWDWRRLLGMTNNGGVHQAGIGMGFDGLTAFVNSNYRPSVDGINYKVQDAMIGSFAVTFIPKEIGRIFGTRAGGGTIISEITLEPTRTICGFNSAGAEIYPTVTKTNDTLLVIANPTLNTNTLFVDGVISKSNPRTHAAIPDGNIYIGKDNIAGDTGESALECTISSFIAGSAIGFDQLAYNNDLVTLNEGLQ